MESWNPWHGCTKYSEGCKNCYVYRMDKHYGRNPSEWTLTSNIELPLKRKRDGSYKYPSGTKFFTCYTSDFFIPEADNIRPRIWEIIKERSDCYFMIITKRIDLAVTRFPVDWGYGYPNVEISCTIESQRQADYRLPIYNSIPIVNRSLCIEPLLESIYIMPYVYNMGIKHIVSGGESGYGNSIRFCKEEWVKDLYMQARYNNIPFCFKQTGTKFIYLNGTMEIVARQNQMKRAIELGYQDFRIDTL